MVASYCTSSKYGLLPLLILVLWVWPHTFTFTTGLMLLPGSCRASMTRTRTWTITSNERGSWTNSQEIIFKQVPLVHLSWQIADSSLLTLYFWKHMKIFQEMIWLDSRTSPVKPTVMYVMNALLASLIPQERRNQNSDNTWKSWGLLAKAFSLLCLRRIGLWLGFPGWLGEVGAAGLPPSVSSSPSSSTSLSPVTCNTNFHLYSMDCFVLLSLGVLRF